MTFNGGRGDPPAHLKRGNEMSKNENMVPYCARMPRGLLEQAKAAARAEGMGLSELVRFLLREYVRRDDTAFGGIRVEWLGGEAEMKKGDITTFKRLTMRCALRKWVRGEWRDVYAAELESNPIEWEPSEWIVKSVEIVDALLATEGGFLAEMLGVEPKGGAELEAYCDAQALLYAELDYMWRCKRGFVWNHAPEKE